MKPLKVIWAVLLCALLAIAGVMLSCQGSHAEMRGGTTSIKQTETRERLAFPANRPSLEVGSNQSPPVLLRETTTIEGQSSGATETAFGDKVELKGTGSAPLLDLPGVGGGSGGSVKASVSALTAPKNIGLMVMGGIFIVGGIALCSPVFGLPHVKPGIAAIAIGATLALAAAFPLLVYIAAGIGVITFVLWVIDAHGKGRAIGALSNVFTAIEGDDAVALRINDTTLHEEDKVIAEAKRRAGL